MAHILPIAAVVVFWCLYGSFFEWYWHKCWMHTLRFPKEAFRGHTLVHHQRYKGDDRYFAPVEMAHPEHILLKPYALPGIVAAHLPLMYLVDRYLLPHTLIPAVVTVTVYFVVYEYMHWNMHVPRGHFVEKFNWFQFLRNHHHLHHRYYRKNFCVLNPLADYLLGTWLTEKSLAQYKGEQLALLIQSEEDEREELLRRRKARKLRVWSR